VCNVSLKSTLWIKVASKPIFDIVHALDEIRKVQSVSILHMDNNSNQYSIITRLVKEIIQILR